MPGVLELLPADQVGFQAMLDTIRTGFERFGFRAIETPAVEYAEILLTKTGGETERQVFLVQSTGAREQGLDPELALRFDLTVPLARYVAEHEHQLDFPFRRYQIQRVYRGESPQRGRFREFYQCDIDVIDRDRLGLRHDAEMPAVIHQVFTDLGIGSFTIRLNHRNILRGFLEQLDLEDEAVHIAVLREIDKLEKRGIEAVSATLGELGLTPDQVSRLADLLQNPGDLAAIEASHPRLVEGIAELQDVIATIGSLGVPDDCYRFDPSIARGLDYYTGTVYETTLDQHPEIGSICSGGRYDDLAGQYTSSALPGVGISIGLTRLFWQLREAGLLAPAPSTVKVLVTLMDDEGLEYALGLATTLRAAGVNTEATLDPGRLGHQLRHADRAGIRFVIIAGSNEREHGTATVKDMVAQTQVEVDRFALAGHMQAQVGL